MPFKKYNELDIWKKAFRFGLECINLSKAIPKNSANYILSNQIIRSATSIAGNIAEGSGASSKRDFINYLNIARKSAIESENWLKFINQTNRISQATKARLLNEAEEIIKILTTIIKNSKK
ncbi:MAG: four helix bundle protein [Patescibacteria group bacterium]